MAIVKEDNIGLYVQSGGWIARPILNSRFVKGDKPDAKHIAGSTHMGVGKDSNCGRGEFNEYWLCVSDAYKFKDQVDSDKKREFEWYKRNCGFETEIMNKFHSK